jgi:hypothetical protein
MQRRRRQQMQRRRRQQMQRQTPHRS